MSLLEDDEQYLKDKGFKYHTYPQADGTIFLVIKDYSIPDNLRPDKADLLVKIPPLYPQAQMDMFWVHPEVRLVSNNQYPQAANVFENYLGLSWQRFSRHYSSNLWRPGIDSLVSHLIFVRRCLEKS
jgi:hypothetical protein